MKTLEYPFTKDAVQNLRAGERVVLSGTVFTGRDRLHKFIGEGGTVPVSLKDGALFHCGPVMVKEQGGWKVLAAGPTTSIREEPYMAGIIGQCGVRVIIGKGGMGAATAEACKKHGCIYVHLVGGAAALTARCVTEVKDVFFLREFGMAEALWVLELAGLEGVVTMDAHGGNLHQDVWRNSQSNFNK